MSGCSARGEGEEWRHRADNARTQLQSLAEGDLDLFGDVDGDGEADDGAGEVRTDAPDRVHTRASLAGFVGR